MTLDRSTITILVVEDEALLRLELVVELQFDGYTILEAGSRKKSKRRNVRLAALFFALTLAGCGRSCDGPYVASLCLTQS
jgi:hypothetical protein